MSFLNPLYALAGLAIALPILFHLIRRRPKERKLISSLMFLDPTPPRLTRQSSIDQWLLLLLRALAIGLLACAFTRPYWDGPAEKDTDQIGIQRMLLIDTSASMRRDGLWAAAVAKAEQIISQSGPTDTISVYQFDSSLRPLVSIENAIQTPASQRQMQSIAALKSASPTWQGTDLGLALLTAADLLQTDWDSSSESNATTSEIIVVTDFQNGAAVERLAEYSWPSSCKVRVERVEAKSKGNARAILLSEEDSVNGNGASSFASDSSNVKAGEIPEQTNAQKIRVRVSNSQDSTDESLVLHWIDEKLQPMDDTKTVCQVPAGNSLTIRMPIPPKGAVALQLDGDRSGFDNRFYMSRSEPIQSNLLCVENASKAPEDSLGYFLRQLPLSDSSLTVSFQSREPASLDPWPSPVRTPLIVASHALSESDLNRLSQYIKQGGHLFWVWDAVASQVDYSVNLKTLCAVTDGKVSEAKVRQYAMLESVDFKHPLFADLADSKFNDFSKLRFWKHRRLESDQLSEWRILAKFDDGSPALICQDQVEKGSGRIWILTAGWQPAESQLALSTKFVPLVSGLFRLASPPQASRLSFRVGMAIDVPSDTRMLDPSGNELTAEAAEEKSIQRHVLSEPGVFRRVDALGAESVVVVNLSDSESNTSVGGLERLEKLGVIMTENKPSKKDDASKRQLRAVELESQQGWWRWVLIGVIGVVGLESVLCIRKVS